MCSCNKKFDLNSRLPYILECGHTFCKTCLREISQKYKGYIPKCTTCSISIGKSFDQIKQNFTVNRILEFLNNIYFDAKKKKNLNEKC